MSPTFLSDKSTSKCPYYNNNATTNNNNHTPPDDADSSSLASSLQSLCPAFENGSCPFAACEDEEQIRSMLLELPASHQQDANGALKHVLQTVQHKHFQHHLSQKHSSLTSLIHQFVLEHPDEEEEDHEDTTQVQNSPATQDSQHRLSVSFKEGTAASHQAAENVHFVRNFIKGKIERDLYEKMLVQLYYVYEALETALLNPDATDIPPALTTIHRSLIRTPSLRADLSYWCPGPLPPPSPATRDYTDRLATCQGMQLVAHAYTRYMGDLSGGRVLARAVRRRFGSTAATDFYDFEGLSAKLVKDEYRAALDAVSCSVEEAVREANVAFILNMRLFEELDVWAHVPGATLREFRPESIVISKPDETNGEAECPFIQSKKKASDEQTTRCPWPFIVLHDPVAAMADWQTWAVIGLVVCYVWSVVVSSRH